MSSSALLTNTERMRDDLEALLSRPRAQQADMLQLRAPEWIESLGDCVSACHRITTIVRSLALFSRRSDVASRPEPTNLNDSIDGVVRLIGREARYQSHVELELDPEQPLVLTPPFVRSSCQDAMPESRTATPMPAPVYPSQFRTVLAPTVTDVR